MYASPSFTQPDVDVSIADRKRGVFTRRRCSTEPVAAVVGASAAAVVVALDTSVTALPELALTFAVFAIAGAMRGRRSRWSTMLPFARIVADVLYPVAAGAVVWVVMASTAAAQADAVALMLATLLAACTGTIARRVASPGPSRVVVVGSPQSADHLHRALLRAGLTQHELVGVVATGPATALADSAVPLLGRLATLGDVIERYEIDMVLVDGAASRVELFDLLAATCLELPVRVCGLSWFYEDAFGHVPATEIDSAWFRYIMHPRFHSADTAAKRAVDLVVALSAGIAFLPAITLCALLIKLHDGGPVLFRQRRIGNRGQEFTLIKLRTMRCAPAVSRWSSVDDDRVTPIGRLLRRMHLDEVPQLLNVLRGEMSVVGPRPEQPEFVARLEGALPQYSRRHLIKPGLTGWAQVHCGYAGSDSGSAWKLCHDLYYLKHQSLRLDIAILVETVRTLVADRQFAAGGTDPVLPPAASPARAVRALPAPSRAAG